MHKDTIELPPEDPPHSFPVTHNKLMYGTTAAACGALSTLPPLEDGEHTTFKRRIFFCTLRVGYTRGVVSVQPLNRCGRSCPPAHTWCAQEHRKPQRQLPCACCSYAPSSSSEHAPTSRNTGKTHLWPYMHGHSRSVVTHDAK